jgi:putative tryptophan/tyrosine transport system substrate-binding protein
MKRRNFLGSTVAPLTLPGRARPQSPTKVFRIGWLTAQKAPSLAQSIDALRAALADLKYVEGRNLVIEFRYADDVIERVPELAAELQRIPVDLIMAQGAAVPVISKLGLTVPVVYVFSGDPVVAGLAETLARPRGNMTGLTFMAAELNGKRLELLREMVPRTRRVAIIANPEHPGASLERAYCEDAARQLGLTPKYFPTRTTDELSSAFATMAADPPQAVSLFADGFAVQNRQRIIEFATAQRAPVISGWPVFAQSGALCTYGPRLQDSYRRLAYYVDRVLKGTRPADLPIERPTTFELVINLRTAKARGVTVQPSLLVRADEVIE